MIKPRLPPLVLRYATLRWTHLVVVWRACTADMLVLVCASILAGIELCDVVPILLGYHVSLGVVGGALAGFARFFFLVLFCPLQPVSVAGRRRLSLGPSSDFGPQAGWAVGVGAGTSSRSKKPAVGGRGDVLELLVGVDRFEVSTRATTLLFAEARR